MRFVFWLLPLALAVGLTAPARAQEIVRFEASRPDGAEKVLLRAELTKPDGTGPFPAVILMHGCGGWQPAVHYALRDHADFLARHGYVVLNLDSFGPRHYSGGALCASNARLQEALVYRAYDAFDAMRYLQLQPFVDGQDIFLMGQSNGGSVALEAAAAGAPDSHGGGNAFRAVVAYYPWCGVYSRTERLVSPLLILSGAKDDWVSARECENIHASGADFETRTYPQAAHSFDVDVLPQRYLGHLIGYDPNAAADSDARMLAFFAAHMAQKLAPKPVTTAIRLHVE